ncbi:hypothetical protein CIW82_07480 [Acetobacter tropicalis]|uniref:Phage neck terminator protein gp12-like domain-containing protein n=2 Tax=Acetobacteraceae TaxID=433 RepID=A0A291PGN3_9PROT|nr:hypothetical protein CIW82_07480 [Acetobacter tropicalis]
MTIQPVTASITTALREFLRAVLPPGLPVQLAQQNRTVAPAGPFVLLTLLTRQPLATVAQTETETITILSVPEEVRVQVSIFGPGAGDNAQSIATLFRTDWACRYFENLFQNNKEEQSSDAESSLGTVAEWLEKYAPVAPEPHAAAQSLPLPAEAPKPGSERPLTPLSRTPPPSVETCPQNVPGQNTQPCNAFPASVPAQPAAPCYAPARIVPLYAGPPRQMPFVNGERQFEEHWLLDLHCQVRTTLTLPTTTASAASLALICADTLTDEPSA